MKQRATCKAEESNLPRMLHLPAVWVNHCPSANHLEAQPACNWSFGTARYSVDHSKVLVSVCSKGAGRSSPEFNSEEGAEGHDRDGFLDELQRKHTLLLRTSLLGLLKTDPTSQDLHALDSSLVGMSICSIRREHESCTRSCTQYWSTSLVTTFAVCVFFICATRGLFQSKSEGSSSLIGHQRPALARVPRVLSNTVLLGGERFETQKQCGFGN